jgi:F0F1-type ATP synthase membrane subunit b/b'
MSNTPRTDAYIGDQDGTYMTEGEIAVCDFARQLERELAACQAGQAELLARLEDRTQSHLVASARDVQTIQQQAVDLAKWQAEAARLSAEREHNANMAGMWQALAEGLAVALKDCKNRAMDKSIETHADDNAKGCVDDIWEWSEAALAAYEVARKAASPLDVPPGPA